MRNKIDDLACNIDVALELKDHLAPAFVRWNLEQALPLVNPGPEQDFVRAAMEFWSAAAGDDDRLTTVYSDSFLLTSASEKDLRAKVGDDRDGWIHRGRYNALRGAQMFVLVLMFIGQARKSAANEVKARESRGYMKRNMERREAARRVQRSMGSARANARSAASYMKSAIASWAYTRSFEETAAKLASEPERQYATPGEHYDAQPEHVAYRSGCGVRELFGILQNLALKGELPQNYLPFMMESLRTGPMLPTAAAD